MSNPIPYWRFPHIILPACQLGDEDWAQLLGVPVEDASSWLDGELEKGIGANDRLAAVVSVIVALGHVRNGRGIADWLRTPSSKLDGVRPLDHLAAGNAPAPVILSARQEAAREWGLGEDLPLVPDRLIPGS